MYDKWIQMGCINQQGMSWSLLYWLHINISIHCVFDPFRGCSKWGMSDFVMSISHHSRIPVFTCLAWSLRLLVIQQLWHLPAWTSWPWNVWWGPSRPQICFFILKSCSNDSNPSVRWFLGSVVLHFFPFMFHVLPTFSQFCPSFSTIFPGFPCKTPRIPPQQSARATRWRSTWSSKAPRSLRTWSPGPNYNVYMCIVCLYYNVYNIIMFIVCLRSTYIWVNYNDLTVLPNPGIMVYLREIISKWPQDSG